MDFVCPGRVPPCGVAVREAQAGNPPAPHADQEQELAIRWTRARAALTLTGSTRRYRFVAVAPALLGLNAPRWIAALQAGRSE